MAAKEGRLEEIKENRGEVFIHYKEVLKCVRYLLDKEKEGCCILKPI